VITIKVERCPQRGTAWIVAPMLGMKSGEPDAVMRHWTREVEDIGYLEDRRAVAKELADTLRAEGYKVRYVDETPGWEAE